MVVDDLTSTVRAWSCQRPSHPDLTSSCIIQMQARLVGGGWLLPLLHRRKLVQCHALA